MKCNRNNIVTKSLSNGSRRRMLRVGSAVLCAAVVGTMIGVAPDVGYKGFAPAYALAEEGGNDLFSDFFGTNGAGNQAEQSAPAEQNGAEQSGQGDGSFSSFFESGSATTDPGTAQVSPTAPATSREAKYQGEAPATVFSHAWSAKPITGRPASRASAQYSAMEASRAAQDDRAVWTCRS